MIDLLGLGIYTVSEAAMYARVSAQKLSRWILGTSSSRPAVVSPLDPEKNEERWVCFLDFVQAMAIRDIRAAHPSITIEKIHETVALSKSRFKIDYPFARAHTTKLYGDNLSLDIKGYGLIEATGPHKQQLGIRTVVEKYLEDLSYDGDGLAKGYSPFSYKGYRIVFNPQVRFGEPTVSAIPKSKSKPCRYTVQTLCDAVGSEGSYQSAARSLGVSQEAVEAAHRYRYDYLRTT